MPKERKPAPPEMTVFISYRRDPSKYFAKNLFDYLRRRGYDVFLDIEKIDSGAFDETILHNIAARMHFIVILAPSTLEDCVHKDGTENKEDWLRREIEYAMDNERNIVPVLMEQFDYSKSKKYMTGKLANLPRYSGTIVPFEFIDEGFNRLHKRFLKLPAHPVRITPLTPEEEKASEMKIEVAAAVPEPTQKQLSAEDYFNKAYDKQEQGDLDGAIADYDKAIELDPQYANPYCLRGIARHKKHDFEGAIADYNKAIDLKSDYSAAYMARGELNKNEGNVDNAIADFTKAIELDPQNDLAYIVRGSAYGQLRDYEKALVDLNKAIELNPFNSFAYIARGELNKNEGNVDDAIADCTKAIEFAPQFVDLAYGVRGSAYRRLGDYEKALVDLNKAIELSSINSFAYADRARIYLEQENFDLAWEDLKKAFEINMESLSISERLSVAAKMARDNSPPFDHADHTPQADADDSTF